MNLSGLSLLERSDLTKVVKKIDDESGECEFTLAEMIIYSELVRELGDNALYTAFKDWKFNQPRGTEHSYLDFAKKLIREEQSKRAHKVMFDRLRSKPRK